jgi:hypothetical protein
MYTYNQIKRSTFYLFISVHDEGYSRNASCPLNVISTFYLIISVHDEGYSRNASCALNFISTFYLIISVHDDVDIEFSAHDAFLE